jgi:hypothetical protein
MMQPMGRRPIRFPGKVDHRARPKRIWRNWWESGHEDENKKRERQLTKKYCKENHMGPTGEGMIVDKGSTMDPEI